MNAPHFMCRVDHHSHAARANPAATGTINNNHQALIMGRSA